jgi:hypothetical protein
VYSLGEPYKQPFGQETGPFCWRMVSITKEVLDILVVSGELFLLDSLGR